MKGLRLSFQSPSIGDLGVLFQCRPAPLCPDADIRNLCQFLATMMRALCRFPGGIGRFIPRRTGTNHSRQRHIGWQKCCHGFTCRPLESSGEGALSDLLSLLGYPAGSGTALLEGTLRLKYQTLPFACKRNLLGKSLSMVEWPIFLLLVAIILEPVGLFPSGAAVSLSKSCKRVRLTKKTAFRCFQGSEQLIPVVPVHDPANDEDPGMWRTVVRRLFECSGPGGRPDETGIG